MALERRCRRGKLTDIEAERNSRPTPLVEVALAPLNRLLEFLLDEAPMILLGQALGLSSSLCLLRPSQEHNTHTHTHRASSDLLDPTEGPSLWFHSVWSQD